MTGRGRPRAAAGHAELPALRALGDVFARGGPTAELGHRITQPMRLHARPHLMPSFVDNHDVDRFLAGGSRRAAPGAAGADDAAGHSGHLLRHRTGLHRAARRDVRRRLGLGRARPLRHRRRRCTATSPRWCLARGAPRVQPRCAHGAAQQPRPGRAPWPGACSTGRQALVVFNTAGTRCCSTTCHRAGRRAAAAAGLYGLEGQPPDQVVGAGGLLS
jgi:hypothetical protein